MNYKIKKAYSVNIIDFMVVMFSLFLLIGISLSLDKLVVEYRWYKYEKEKNAVHVNPAGDAMICDENYENCSYLNKMTSPPKDTSNIGAGALLMAKTECENVGGKYVEKNYQCLFKGK